MKNFLPFIFLAFPILLTAQGMIVNEISNGTSGTKEFMEFVVVGSAAEPNALVNLSGWMIDDNNGDFEGLVSGVGIAAGHLRIAPGCLSAVKPGSIILLYNGADLNTAIPAGASDATDADSDCIYILNITDPCIEACTNTPFFANAGSNSGAYNPCNAGTATWNQVGMSNAQDVGQVRMPDGTFFHGYSYGLNAPFPTFPAALGGGSAFNVTGSGTGGTFFFNSGNFTDVANFSRAAASTADSPGAPNNDANRYFINALRAGTFDYSNLSNPLNSGTAAALEPCPNFLPIYLSRFEAKKQDKEVRLMWSLESATTDFFDFEIQRSSDGIEFVKIGSLQGNRDIQHYQDFDYYPLGDNYYRLKMIDANGEVTFSQVRYIHFDNFALGTTRIYPNPLSSGGLLYIDSQENIDKVMIYNTLGQLLFESSELQHNQVQLPSAWPAGMYSVVLQLSGNQIVEKLIID